MPTVSSTIPERPGESPASGAVDAAEDCVMVDTWKTQRYFGARARRRQSVSSARNRQFGRRALEIAARRRRDDEHDERQQIRRRVEKVVTRRHADALQRGAERARRAEQQRGTDTAER